jgi:hypothetical protein
MGLSGFLGVDSADHLGTVSQSLLGLKGSLSLISYFFSGDSLADHFSMFVDPDVRGRRESFSEYI